MEVPKQACDDAIRTERLLFKSREERRMKDEYAVKVERASLVAYKEQLEFLPSAQPERTCVNCGRTANNGGWYADGGTRCPIEEHYALPKDGYCHLWEKRNITDDDYPERRTDD